MSDRSAGICNRLAPDRDSVIVSGEIADNQAVAGALVMDIAGATRVVAPDTGHLMYLEKPEVFSSLVSGFLTSHAF